MLGVQVIWWGSNHTLGGEVICWGVRSYVFGSVHMLGGQVMFLFIIISFILHFFILSPPTLSFLIDI